MVRQNVQAQCSCESIKGLGFAPPIPDATEKEIQRIVDQYRALFDKSRRPAIRVKINVTNCFKGQPAIATICGSMNHGYIFYDSSFFNKLRKSTTWGDDFVLAHEIAHHAWGHLIPGFYMGKQKQFEGSTEGVYENTSPRRYFHELEADALGLRMIRLQGANFEDFNQIFTTLLNLLHVSEADKFKNSPSHPSWAMRWRMLLNQWRRETRGPLHASTTQFDSTMVQITDNDTTTIRREVGEAYAFYLQNEIPLDSLSKTELAMRDSLKKDARYFIEPLIGMQFQQPELFRNNQSVMATANRSLYAGIRIGVLGSWYSQHRTEADLLYSVNAFNTQDIFNDQVRTIEHFQMQWISIRPRYVFTHLIHRSPYRYQTHGFMLTGGTSIRVPIGGLTYENFGIAPHQKLDLKPNVNWTVGAGYTLSNWRTNGQIRLYLLYEPQVLRFQTDAPDRIRAKLNTFSIEVSARFW